MNLRLLASGLVFSLALAGCRTVTVEGDYNLADHPGKALVALSTRMTAGEPCPHFTVQGELGFRRVEERGGPSVVVHMQAPLPERKVSTFSEMAGEQEMTIAADPPTRFVVQEVPAGRYVLNSVFVFANDPMKSRASATSLPSVSFDVKDGEVVYLGELGVRMYGGDCKRLIPGISNSATFSVQDEWERDERPFKATIHNISPAGVRKRLITIQ